MKIFLNIILMLIGLLILKIGLSFTISIIGNPPLAGNPILVHIAYWLFGPILCFMGGGIFFLCIKALQSETTKPVKRNLMHPIEESSQPPIQGELNPIEENHLPSAQEKPESSTIPVKEGLTHITTKRSTSSTEKKKSATKVPVLEVIILLIGLVILAAGLTIIETYGSTTGDIALIQVAFGIILSLVGGGVFYLAIKSLQYNSAKSIKKTKQPTAQMKSVSTPEKAPNKKTPTINIVIIILLTISLFGLLMLGLFMTIFVFMFSGTISISNPISQFALWGSIITGFALLMVIVNSNKH